MFIFANSRVFARGAREEFGNPEGPFRFVPSGLLSIRLFFGVTLKHLRGQLNFWLFVLASGNDSGHRAGICIIWIMLGDVCSSVVVPCTCGDHTGQV